ncbi:MAG: flavin-containing monooxygenase [Candidatus Wenzhouxiangella sp. M2_3B_020]
MTRDASRTDERVCVVGAGVSGLAATNALSSAGFHIDTFDARTDLGGTWHPDKTYPHLRTNDVRDLYRYPDLPYPATADEYPTAEQVRAYLHEYADRFDLRRHLQFGTGVTRIQRVGETRSVGRFRVTLQSEDSTLEREYDKVVVCNGVFCRPKIPRFDGDERFEGTILHSSEVGREQLEGRRVVVIGGGKSAYDMAEAAAEYAQACTLVFRSAHWVVPRYVFGLRADWMILTRLAQAFLPYHTKRGVAALLHRHGKPVVELYWRLMTAFLKRYVDVPDELEPDISFPVGFQDIGAGTEMYDQVRAGRIDARRGEIDCFEAGTAIRLDTGATIQADLVVCATGFTQPLDFLDDELRRDVQDEDGFFTLYRHILPPRQRNLGFIGYASSVGTTLTAEVGAHWLASHFLGRMDLPEVEVMDKEIQKVKEWAARMLPRESGGHVIAVYLVDYLDQLMEDLRLPTGGAGGWLTKYFGRVHAERYRDLGSRYRA